MLTSRCLDAVTGGMILSRRECPDARAQPKITFRLCGVLETTHCCQVSGAAWASTSGVPDLCNPESVASWYPQTPGEHRSMCCGCGEVGSHLAGRVGCMVGLLVTLVQVPKFPEMVFGKKRVARMLLAVFSAAKWYFCVGPGV